MKTHRLLCTIAVFAAFSMPASRLAADEPPPAKKPIVLAVLDFASTKDETKDLAAVLPDLVESSLSTRVGIVLVTRRELAKIQEEQKLDLAGLAAQGQGAQVGNLVGAQILVVGRVSLVDDEVVLSAKAIGAETGAFLPAVIRAPVAGLRPKMAEELAKKLWTLLEERSGEILPTPSTADAERAKTKEAIAALGATLPRVAVHVPEKHLRTERASDPAVEAALLTILPELGFPLAAVGGPSEAEWLRRAAEGHATFPAPATLAAEVVVVGEGFSEFGGRVGEFVSCRARLELRAYGTKTGKILGTWTGRGAGADLSELFAGKKALEDLGRRAALELGLTIAKAWAAEKK